MNTQIKYCGAKNEEDCKIIAESSAQIIGFVFAPSKRQVTAEQVRNRSGFLPSRIRKAGVFQNSSPLEVIAAAEKCGLDIIQFHGDEPIEQLSEIKARTGLTVFKALKAGEKLVEEMIRYGTAADGYIIDSAKGSQFGGTGITFDWTFIPAAAREAHRQGASLYIAGGITAENLARLLTYKPDGIDVSSGIEENGQKSVSRIRMLERVIEEYENKTNA
jgi:phosphoribosylanthranilate isomerase